ncbi:hypothetical protein ACVWWN_006203 [Mycobacterium sp. URHB0021]
MMSWVAYTGTVIRPNGEVTCTMSPSAICSSEASSTCMSARWVRSPRISNGALCIPEFSDRGSSIPIIRIG